MTESKQAPKQAKATHVVESETAGGVVGGFTSQRDAKEWVDNHPDASGLSVRKATPEDNETPEDDG